MWGFLVIILAWGCGLEPRRTLVTYDCELIEYNHVQDDDGKVVFSQLIFWRYEPGLGRLVVATWVSTTVAGPIKPQRRDGNYYVYVNKFDRQYQITAPSFVETWGYDSEQLDRQNWSKENRGSPFEALLHNCRRQK